MNNTQNDFCLEGEWKEGGEGYGDDGEWWNE